MIFVLNSFIFSVLSLSISASTAANNNSKSLVLNASSMLFVILSSISSCGIS